MNANTQHATGMVFQFHLVRLKVRNSLKTWIIPFEFQFHLVRLKDLISIITLSYPTYFNSI